MPAMAGRITVANSSVVASGGSFSLAQSSSSGLVMFVTCTPSKRDERMEWKPGEVYEALVCGWCTRDSRNSFCKGNFKLQ